MKTTKVNWNVKKLSRMADNGSLNFNYPIQRAGGQWDELQKSLLIHSIAGDYPVPPVLVLAGDDVDYVLDGKQRITNILDFVSGEKDEEGNYPVTAYPLHVETPNVSIDEMDEEFELAGKFFDQLHEDLQREILGVTLSISRLEGATDDEIEELFYRWNNGTPLTKQQKARAKMGVGNATVISELLTHNFIQSKASFTPLQRRRSDDEAVILQTMMLMDATYEIPSDGFVANNILKYATDMREADVADVTNAIKEAMDYANEAIEGEKNPLFKKLHLPTVLIVAKKAKDEGVEPEVFGAWVEDFNNAINGRTRDKALVKTNYKNYTGAGSVKKDKTTGRKNAMITHFNEFVDRYEPTIEEPKADTTPKAEDKPVEPSKEVVTPSPEEVLEQAEKQEKDVEEVFAGIDEVLVK